MKIIKRDGKIVNYNREKIITAISKANKEVSLEERVSSEQIEEIVLYIESLNRKRMLVEDIQDIIENKLMEYGKFTLAKTYIVYRYTRALVRRKNVMDESILGLIKKNEDDNDNGSSEIVQAAYQRNLIAGEVSKELARKILLPPKIAKSHEDGEIFFNDKEYFLQAMFDSSFLDLKAMLDNGTVINNKLIETPNSFQVACLVTSQIVMAVTSNQYGGVTIDLSVLGKYLRKSKIRATYKLEDYKFIDEAERNKLIEETYKRELSLGIELIEYQLNTLMTTNGQYPNVTLFMSIDEKDEYKEEVALIIEEVLKQRIKGIKNENGEFIPTRFPKLVYLLNENNISEGTKYYYLTKLALACSKKGGYPDFLSEKMIKKYYKNNVFPPIGDNIFLLPYMENDEYKTAGRFNQGLVTINLANIVLATNANENAFFKLLGERIELAKEALMCKYYALLSTSSSISPLHYIYGGISHLEKGESINTLLNDGYSTLLFGIIGLEETVRAFKSTKEEKQEFAIKILKKIRNAIDRYRQVSGLGFALYTRYDPYIANYFALKDKKQFGVLEGVNDKGYYASGLSLIDENMELIDRLNLEKELASYFNGGHSHIIDISEIGKDNKFLLDFMYNNLLYVKFRQPENECKVCGYKGQLIKSERHAYECPNCHNKDKTKFSVHKPLHE